MPLLERVGTLLRSNLNDLIERAEDPEKLCKQLVLDMENQLIQVKTQVAMAIADQHLLNKKRKEHDDAVSEWRRKAELAVEKQKDDLARAALERSLQNEQLANAFAQQIEDRTAETELLRSAYQRLERKLTETRSECEILIAQSEASPCDRKGKCCTRPRSAERPGDCPAQRERESACRRRTRQITCCSKPKTWKTASTPSKKRSESKGCCRS